VALDIDEMKSEGGATLTKAGMMARILSTGPNPKFDTYTLTTHTDLKGITGRTTGSARGCLDGEARFPAVQGKR